MLFWCDFFINIWKVSSLRNYISCKFNWTNNKSKRVKNGVLSTHWILLHSIPKPYKTWKFDELNMSAAAEEKSVIGFHWNIE